MTKLKAMIESRRGPSIFQPYRDIWKFLRKETLFPGILRSNSSVIRYPLSTRTSKPSTTRSMDELRG